MSAPVSFTIRPPTSAAPARPSPLGRNGAGGWKAPSQRMFADDGSDDEDGPAYGAARRAPGRAKDERVDGLGGRPSAKAAPLVIAPQPNRDWRQSSQRRAPGYRPETTREAEAVTHERTGDEPQRSGLRRAAAQPEVADDGTLIKAELELDDEAAAASTGTAAGPEPLSLDDEALAAVLAGEHAESATDRLRRELVIATAPGGPGGLDARHAAEDGALARDLAVLPAESTLDDYAAVPVEAFGAAILRGMGYDPANDTKVHVPKPRPALLGIGATPAAELPGPPARKDAKKRKEEYAKRGGRGYNAAQLLVRKDSGGTADGASERGDSRGSSRRASPESDGKRRREDDAYESRKSVKREDDAGYRDRERDRGVRDDGGRSGRDGRDRDDRDDRDRRDWDRDSEKGRDRDERDRRREREYETEDERARRKARAREREYETDEERARRKARERERDRASYGRDRNGGDRGRDRDGR